jgi:formylglycine-generating enzyme required for sulfatase activity
MAAAGLRIVCDGDNLNAEVFVNNKFKGECPLDMQLKEGKYKLLVKKAVGELERTFEEDIRLGDGVLKKIEVQLGAPQINAEKLRSQRADFERAERSCPDCPAMVFIPPGSFEMGLNSQYDSEKPAHRVSVKAFALGKTEVTQGQWRAIMGSNPSKFTDCGDNCPVDKVSWDDAKEYIQKLNAKTGKQYRLPSEAEWEYACRAGGKHEYCGSDDINSVAWYGAYATPVGNSAVTTNPVATKQANTFGVYDMSGNVWEWVEDSLHDNYNGAPSDGSAWQGDGEKRMVRGGSWSSETRDTRAASRGKDEPAKRYVGVGFRVARKLP